MEFIKAGTNFDFMRYKVVAPAVSGIVILASIFSLWVHGGPNYGIDFRGGILIQLKFHQKVDVGEVRDVLSTLGLRNLVVQRFGLEEEHEYLVRVEQMETDLDELSGKIEQALKERYGAESLEVRRTEIVGPKVGAELRRKGFLAVLYSIVGILIYITWRFEFRFALGAVLALVHDALITIGCFSFLNKEINLPEVAAVLTVIGYSVNDTIVIFDRIRENMRKIRRQALDKVVNSSINETLSRTLLTSGTTLVVVVALFFLGGPVIHNFAFALMVGIVVGTYSSIYVASPIVLFWDYAKERLEKRRTQSASARKTAR